jgi:hypothetical protein
MKKPTLDRGPKLNSAIAQPQMMITSGVRQPMPWDGRSSAVTVMQIPRYGVDPEGRRNTLQGVNASAWKSQTATRGKHALHCSVANDGGQKRQIGSPAI